VHNGAVSDTGGAGRTESQSMLYKAGIWLVTIGVVLIGWGAWEYWGTNILAKHNQEQTVEELIDAWSDPEFNTPDGAFALMRIPAFGDDYVMPVLEGIEDSALTRGLGHYSQTALPGEVGNFAVAGHRVTHGEPFREFPKLEPGDEVEVETADAIYTYAIDNDPGELVVQPYDGWVLEPVPPGTMYDEGDDEPSQAILTLTTCGALVHTSDRMIAFAHLVSTEDK
jgi:sortase A